MRVLEKDHTEKLELAPALLQLTSRISTCPEPELPELLRSRLHWNKPRGDLFHWISVLNRFDEIYERTISKYALEDECAKLLLMEPADELLLVACLNFSFMLLEHCENRSVYSSGERIVLLIHTPTISVRLAALEVLVSLSERYHSSKFPSAKLVKKKVLQILHSFPPMVPQGFDFGTSRLVIGDHCSYMQLLRHGKVPSKWKQISFPYYQQKPKLGSPQKKVDREKSQKIKSEKPAKEKLDKLERLDKEVLCTLQISSENVRRLSVQQLLDKASETLPKELWFEFGLQAHISKAFNSNSHEALALRQELLRCKLYAICFVLCNSSEEQIIAAFEPEPYILNFIVEMVEPALMDKLSPEVYFLAVKTLGCVSLKRVWGGELIRTLGGNVNHGVLYQSLRHMRKQLLENSSVDSKGYIYFFNMLGNLMDVKSLIPRLASGGILKELMQFLHEPHRYWWLASAAVHLIAVFLFNSPESITEFVDNNGFDMIIKAMGAEVQQGLEDPLVDGGAPLEAVVYYKIAFRKANFMRNLIKLVNYLIRWDSGDRLRNLFDSPLLQSFNQILRAPTVFGPMVLGYTIDSIFYIIHNEPTAFGILEEAQVISNVLQNFDSFLMPDPDLLSSLPEVLGAISLNKKGLQYVQESGCFETFFQLFRDPTLCRLLLTKNYRASALGESFDELGRHYETFKPMIIEQVRKLLADIPPLVNKDISGVRYYTEEGPIDTWAKSKRGAVYQVTVTFLRGLVCEGNWGEEIEQKIPFEEWLSLLDVPNFPYDFSLECFFLMELTSYFIGQEDNHHHLPAYCKYLRSKLNSDSIREFLASPDDTSFYQELTAHPQKCTRFLRDLNSIYIAMTSCSFTSGFMSHENYKGLSMIFGDDEGLAFLRDLGTLLRKLIVEENFIRTQLPQDIIIHSTPLPEEVSENPKLRIFMVPPADVKDPDPSLKLLAPYKNALQVRHIYFLLTHLIADIINYLGKIAMHRRQEYAQATLRRNAVRITVEFGEIFAGLLDSYSSSLPNADSYLFMIVSIIWYVLHQRDRGKDTVHTTLVISFLQANVFSRLQEIGAELFSSCLHSGKDVARKFDYVLQDPESISRNTLLRVFTLFSSIVDSSNYLNFGITSYFFHHLAEQRHDVFSSVQTYSVRIAQNLVKQCLQEIQLQDPGFSHMPVKIIEKFVQISLKVYRHELTEEGSTFYFLDWKNVSPPYEATEYLKLVGLPETSSIHYFKHETTLKRLANGEWPCPTSSLEHDELERISQQVRNDDKQFLVDIRKVDLLNPEELFPTSGNLKQWFIVAKEFPSVSDKIASFLVESPSGRSLKLEEFDQASVIAGKTFLEHHMPLAWSLMEQWLKVADYELNEQNFHLQPQLVVSKAVINLLKHDPSAINQDYVAYSLEVVYSLLCFQDLPAPEQSKHESLNNITSKKIFLHGLLSDEQLDELFELLTLSQPENKRSLLLIVKILIIMCKNQDKREQLVMAPFCKILVKQVHQFIPGDSTEDLETQQAFAILYRRCFETKDVIKLYMTAQIKQNLAVPKAKRDLTSFLKECLSLAIRDPEVFVEVVSKYIRLQHYDGEILYFTRMPITVVTDPPLEDVDMETGKSSSIGESCMMYALVSEIIDVCKRDIYSNPEGVKVSTKKKDQVSELFKNKHFAYLCYLLQVLTELLGSYMKCKLEFITYSKKGVNDSVKPRSTALNVLIHQLIPTQLLISNTGIEYERRASISSLAKLAILGLVSTPVQDERNSPAPKKEDADVAFIRKFCTDLMVKALKDTSYSRQPAQIRYSKLVDIFDLISSLLSNKFRQVTGPLSNKEATKYDSFFISKCFLENLVPATLTSFISTFDLNAPDIDKIIKAAIHPLTLLGKLKSEYQEIFEDEKLDEKDDELPELEDDDNDAPDLFKNSTLGMYDIENDTDEEEYYEDRGMEMSDEEHIEDSDDMGGSMDEDSDIESDIESDDMEEDEEEEIIDDRSMLDSYHMEDAGEDFEQEEYDNLFAFDQYDEFSENEDDGVEDVEIIDTTVVGDGSDASEYYFEDQGENEDQLSSEYDEAELDGWIEDLGSDSVEEENDDGPRSHPVSRQNPERTAADNISDDDVDDDIESDGDTTADEFDARLGANIRPSSHSLFNALHPEMSRSFADAFDRIFTAPDPETGALAGVVRITENGWRSLDNALSGLMGSAQRTNNTDPLRNLYIMSTNERWNDAVPEFHKKHKDKIVFNLVPAIVNRIGPQSVEIEKSRQQKAEHARREREEKRKKREDEEKARKEQEEREREASLVSNPRPSLEPVMVTIGDREVDISGTDIDPEFFEALPDDMREEVFTQHVRERRASARTGSHSESTREIDPDFLDALPDQIRDEILQQETMTRYSYLRNDDDDAEEDDDFDSEGDFLSALRTHQSPEEEKKKKKKNSFFTPLVDKAGVAAIVRLLFVPQTTTKRDSIHQTIKYLCYNKQTRVELIHLLLSILYESLVNQKPNDKIFHHLTIKSFRDKDAANKVKSSLPLDTSPVIVADQILDLLLFLLENNTQLRYFFVTEHENYYISKHKKQISKLVSKADKYQLNYLLSFLDNNVMREDQLFMDLLSRILQLTTKPLNLLKNKKDSDKPVPFSPPYVPDHLLSRIVKLLVSDDCPGTTFTRAISAMQSLTNLENAQRIFSVELSDRASSLGRSIIQDLNSLTQELKKGKYDTESKTFAKFNASSSDQAKLLRVLTALDYMFEKKDKDKETPVLSEVEELAGLYKKLALGSLWDALSDCLKVLEENASLSNIATILLPLIEALMVVCKHSKVRDIQVKDAVKYEAKKVDFTKEPIENLFFSFTDEHKKILNQMVRTNPNLMSGPFTMLVRNPKVLEFDNKKNYFDRKLHENINEDKSLVINVRREQVFLDSYRSLFFKSKEEFRNSKLDVNFKGESGIDAGGVTREWYQVLSRQMFNPDYALFTPVASDSNTYHPNRTSYINPEHLSFFKFIGKVIGKAIFDNCFLDCHFSRAVYKRILGRSVSLKDMETLDLEYFKSLIWILENDITDVITEDFLVETDDYGEKKIIDLIPDGRNIPVTEENKQDYVKLVTEYRLQTSVAEQMDNFLLGFHEIIPKDLVSIFDEQELELLISGLPDIDVQDWQSNTTYNNYSPSSIQIQWFWRAVKSFDNEERAKLLQFATGTSKVPLNGFKELRGANDGCKFSIHRDYGSTDRLPSSHTCFNQIDLPAYESYETLRGSLLLAITEGHEGFGMA